MEEKRESRVGCTVATLVAMLVLLPVLYVLSSGPATNLVLRRVVSKDVFFAIYRPLFYETFPVFDNTLVWYWELWSP